MKQQGAAFPARATAGTRRRVLFRFFRGRAAALAALAAVCAGGAGAQSLDDAQALAMAAHEVATILIREAEESGGRTRATFQPAYARLAGTGGMSLYCDALSSRLRNLLRDKTVAEGNKRRSGSFDARLAHDRELRPPAVTTAWRYDRREGREVVKLEIHVWLPDESSIGVGVLPEIDVSQLTAAQRLCLYGFDLDRRNVSALYDDVLYASAPEMDPRDIAAEYAAGDTLAVIGRLTIRGEPAPWVFVRRPKVGGFAHMLAHTDALALEEPPGVRLTVDAPAGGAIAPSQLRVVDAARIPDGGIAGPSMVAGGCWSRALPAGSPVDWPDIALCP